MTKQTVIIYKAYNNISKTSYTVNSAASNLEDVLKLI